MELIEKTMINKKIFDKTLALLLPYMNDAHNRRALVSSALFGCSVLEQIDWTGNAQAFSVHLVETLLAFGECDSGRLAIVMLLEEIKTHTGFQKAAPIQVLIEAYSAPPQTPPVQSQETSVIDMLGPRERERRQNIAEGQDETSPLRQSLPPVVSPPRTPEWIAIPGGTFLAGAAQSLHVPEQQITLSSFYIARTPVTQAEYEMFVSLEKRYLVPGDRYFPAYSWDAAYREPPADKRDHPVVLVSHADAQAYCIWLTTYLQSTLRGLPGTWRVQLPTEYQWERAARGDDGRPYPWGVGSPQREICNFGGHEGGTTPVHKYSLGKSPYGVLDLAGNVWEWTSTEDNGEYVVRGGSWEAGVSAQALQCAFRHREAFDYIDHAVGFRVALVRDEI